MKREDETELEEREPTHVITELEVFKVDLVKRPATGDKFLMVRSDESEDSPMPKRRVFAPDQFNKLRVGQSGETIVETQAAPESVERAVPKPDATSDSKRKAQKKRSEKYGIEVWENKGENLSYPKGDPTKETLYGDPVNLKYPVAYDDNKLSLKRANNARARFKQSYARYNKASQKIIHTRIVQAQLKAGANPAYDPDDALDKMLPKELRDKMKQPIARNDNETEDEAMSTKLEKTVDRLTVVVERMEGVFTGLLAQSDGNAPAATEEAPAEPSEPAPEPEEAPEGETSEEAPAEPSEPAPEPEGEEDTQPGDSEPEEAPAASEGDPSQTPQNAPQGDAPAASAPAPAEPVAPVSAPAPAPAVQDSPAVEALAGNVEKLGGIVERFAQETRAQFEKLGGRVETVERSLRTGNATQQDNTDEPQTLERGNNGAGIFTGLIFPENG